MKGKYNWKTYNPEFDFIDFRFQINLNILYISIFVF